MTAPFVLYFVKLCTLIIPKVFKKNETPEKSVILLEVILQKGSFGCSFGRFGETEEMIEGRRY